MKKILGIIVLGLLLSGNAYAGKSYQGKNGMVYEGWSKLQFCNQEFLTMGTKAFCRHRSEYFQNGIEVNEWKGSGQYAIFKNVSTPVGNNFWNRNWGNGTFHAIAYGWPEVQKVIDELQNKNVVSSSRNTADKITQSKQICKDLGFKTNTEKFADCALQMMSIQFETTNKVASSGGTKQEIIVKHKNDYDVFDAMLDMSNSLLSNNSNSSNSSSSSSGTRCVAQKTHAWGHTVINCN
tara:strand:+ start:2276 stop:2986 length:711 start_codon:yes stop_codon:yes gene_type:complete